MENQRNEGDGTACSSAVIEPVAQPKKQHVRKRQPRYKVILWDDDDHSYDYVIEMMKKLFGFSIERGFRIAAAVDQFGSAVCLTTTMEHAELKRDQIIQYGRDVLIASSKCGMRSTIEPISD